MQVAYAESRCHCDEAGVESVTAVRHNEVLRLATPGIDPALRERCVDCGWFRIARTVVLLGRDPVEPLTETELVELSFELEGVCDHIELEEATRPYIWPSLLERRDQLLEVERIQIFEDAISLLLHAGVPVTVDMLKHREHLRAKARRLIPVPF